jgi:tetratricopeptide (TPR) repeat protein
MLAAASLAACTAPRRPHPRALEEVRRGYRHLASGDRERAEVAFEHALEIAPGLPEGLNGLGVALRLDGRTAEAMARYAEALAGDPDLAAAHANRGEALASGGCPGAAEEAFGAALAIDPDLEAARIDRARLLVRRARGAAEPEREHLLLRARRDLLHLLEAREDLPWAHHDLGWIAFARGDLAGAEAAYARAAALDPRLAEAHHGRCVALALLGRCGEAALACRRCLEVAPADPRCRRSLAGAEACPREGSGP